MISEKIFSRGYSSFWIEYFPWLNSYCQSINKYSLKEIHSPIEESDKPEHRAINNTIAFFHFRNIQSDMNYNLEKSKEETIEYIKRFPRNSVGTYRFSKINKSIVDSQIRNLKTRYKKDLKISPFFPGCGILDSCHGDIIQGETLIEIKAGDRNIIPSDLKQLIVYSALNWISDPQKYELSIFEVYNPRVGYSWTNSIDDFLLSITDIPKEDVFDQLIKYLVTQSEDVEIN